MTHTFCICAYKESEYLEECILSLLNQTVKSKIILATSTVNGHITSLAQKYGIPLYENTGVKGIGGDWNFALSKAETDLVTVAHQDDIYESTYAEKIIARAEKCRKPIIVFSSYGELRNGKRVYKNKLLNVKRLMLFPLKLFPNSIFVRRRILSLGCPICCPAVTYKTEIIKQNPFKYDFKSDLDWQQWENLSTLKGSFAYISKPLMCHRIHSESATTEIIGDNLRNKEDYLMFRKFWSEKTAKKLAGLYATSEKSNSIKGKE